MSISHSNFDVKGMVIDLLIGLIRKQENLPLKATIISVTPVTTRLSSMLALSGLLIMHYNNMRL